MGAIKSFKRKSRDRMRDTEIKAFCQFIIYALRLFRILDNVVACIICECTEKIYNPQKKTEFIAPHSLVY